MIKVLYPTHVLYVWYFKVKRVLIGILYAEYHSLG